MSVAASAWTTADFAELLVGGCHGVNSSSSVTEREKSEAPQVRCDPAAP